MTLPQPRPDKILGWAWRPDSEVTASLSRGVTKIRNSHTVPKPKEKKMVVKKKLKDLNKPVRSKKKVKAAAESKKKTKVESKKRTGGLIPLKRICQELDLDPKATRVRLRRLKEQGQVEFHSHSSRWEFTEAQAKEIRSLLKG